MIDIIKKLPEHFELDPIGMTLTVKKAGRYSYDAQGAGWTYFKEEPSERKFANYFEIDPLTLTFRVDKPGKYEYDAQSGAWMYKGQKSNI